MSEGAKNRRERRESRGKWEGRRGSRGRWEGEEGEQRKVGGEGGRAKEGGRGGGRAEEAGRGRSKEVRGEEMWINRGACIPATQHATFAYPGIRCSQGNTVS